MQEGGRYLQLVILLLPAVVQNWEGNVFVEHREWNL